MRIWHLDIANIFCKYLVKNIFQNIFFQFKKKIFAIPKCYTILESWEQMPQHGFDKNLIWRIFFFNIQRGDPLDLQKRFLQCGGVILHEKKFCKTRSSSNMSKNALLSASGWNPKLHNYHPPLSLLLLLRTINWRDTCPQVECCAVTSRRINILIPWFHIW